MTDTTANADPVRALPMETAPRDGTTLRLLVQFTDNATEYTDGPAWTIGSNSRDNTGDEEWQIAGWCWSHDHYTEGKGEPVGWLPMHDVPAALAQQAGAVSPAQCRNRLQYEGKPYPRSGCAVCKTGGMTGCPYERAVHYPAPQPAIPEGVIPAPKRHPSPDPDTGADRGSCCAHAHADGWNECRGAVIAALAQHNREGV